MTILLLPLLKFQPVLLEKPWGGNALWRLLGKGKPEDARMGESWEISDRSEAPGRISGGALNGMDLHDILTQHNKALFGEKTAQKSFPLLYKFICAREKLSVQVHPGSGSSLGEAKTECWYVVDAEPGAELILGVVSGGRSREETLEILKSPRCEEVLKRYPARKGDVFFIPAGTVHAITEGLLLYEVQQNSDTTFRLYDWGRVDSQGRGRPLHLQEASEVADLEDREGFKIPLLRITHSTHSEDFLVACPYFALVKWHNLNAPAVLKTHDRFRVISVMSGTFTAKGSDGEALVLKTGETVLVPACQNEVILEADSPEAEAVVSFVPDWTTEIQKPLNDAGYSDADVLALHGPPGIYF